MGVAGAQAQTGVANVQAGALVTGGGDGSGSVDNSLAVTVTDTGLATGKSGLSAAEPVPTTASGTPLPSGTPQQALASSGPAAATGLTVQNAVSNQSQAGVITGGSDAPVSVKQSADVTVQNTGISNAESGDALAKVSGPGTGVATVAGASATAGATGTAALGTATPETQKSTGLTAVNHFSGSMSVAATPAGKGTPLAVVQSQSVVVNSAGIANVAPTGTGTSSASVSPSVGLTGSATVGAGTATPTPGAALSATSTPPPTRLAGASDATTGSANAHGLIAQNSVSTTANVEVRVGGENKGIIQVIVETVTRIFNGGQADAQSGDAIATGGSGAGATGSGTSAGADATGSQVSNNIKLGSSTTVRSEGDNRDPISIFVNFAVQLFNRGHATATTADTKAAGAGGATAGTGNARATGLEVQNVVDMWADVLVDIEGSNYAPILVYVRFYTEIYNLGYAQAKSGSAQALDTASRAASTAGGAANGVRGGDYARSGSVSGTGLESQISAASVQLAGVAGPDPDKRRASNEGDFTFNTRGEAKVVSGNALLGPTPTFTPTVQPNAYGTNGTGGGRQATASSGNNDDSNRDDDALLRSNAQRRTLRIRGTLAKVDPWAGWPSRGRPAMPGQRVLQMAEEAPPVRVAGHTETVDPWVDRIDFNERSLPGQRVLAPQVVNAPLPRQPVARTVISAAPVPQVTAPLLEDVASLIVIDDEFDTEVGAPSEPASPRAGTPSAPAAPPSGPGGSFPFGLLFLVLTALLGVLGWMRPVWLSTRVRWLVPVLQPVFVRMRFVYGLVALTLIFREFWRGK